MIWCLMVEKSPRLVPASTQMNAVAAHATADLLKCIAEISNDWPAKMIPLALINLHFFVIIFVDL